MIITIDGPVATGKSTIARNLAKALGYIYFDTGAMYRIATFAIQKHHIDLKKDDQLKGFLKTFEFDIKLFRGVKRYFYSGEEVTDEIRKPSVTDFVSEVAASPAVRNKLTALQRELSEGVNAVFEGRDMGTTVFPNAPLKIFLSGSVEVRAKRRYDELIERFPELKKEISIEKVIKEISDRDEHDSNREISPLKKADDAFVVDTSNLDPDEIVFKILECKDTIKSRGMPPQPKD